MNFITNSFEDEAIRELLELCRVCRSDLEGLTQRTAGSLLRSIKFRVMDRIIDLAGKKARLSGYDDSVFDYSKRIMELYSRAVKYYELHSAKLNTFSIKNLIIGICEVLIRRIQLFEDQAGGSEENPIAIERIKLLTAGVAYFMFSFNESEKDYKYTRLRALELAEYFTPEFYNVYIERIQNDIMEGFKEKNYPAYKKAVQVCLNSLNSIESRKKLSYYYSLLSDESAVLSFIYEQSAEIEQELSRNAGNSLEHEIVRTFLSIVNNAQLLYNSECKSLLNEINEMEDLTAPEPENIEELCGACGDMLANSRLIANKDYFETEPKFMANVQMVNNCLENNADLLIGKILSQLNLSDLQAESERKVNDLVFNARQTAETIICVFARQISFYRENSGYYLKLNENDIINGINETLIIKTEVLAENIAAFEETKCNFNSGDLLFTIKERELLLEELFPVLRGKFFIETDENDIIMDAFYKDAAETKAITSYYKRIEDICQKEEERAQKAVKRFYKDNVLFEISTFEEILQYSVTRLRESENENVQNYVDMIDECARIIENTLKEVGIAMIRPNPHEYFNGKEHEILMAEHIEGFAKGEIIKSIASGYRLNDQILIRANIIAAK